MRFRNLSIAIFLLILVHSIQVKAQYDFTVDDAQGCTPMKVKFSFISTAATDSIDTYYWDFGNGETSNLQDPDTITYTEPGKYDLTLLVRFAGGYELWIVKPDSVIVNQAPQANFNYTNPEPSYYYYRFEQNGVTDTGNYYDFIWNIEEFIPRTGAVQEITFPRVDTFTVTLTVSADNGCSSSISKEVAILQSIIIPNVFSPGGSSSVNDLFVVQSAGDIPLRMKIYSRTGIMVYETEGPVIVWNGETASGDKLKTGVYFYTIEAINGDPNKIYTKSGFFHMYRKE